VEGGISANTSLPEPLQAPSPLVPLQLVPRTDTGVSARSAASAIFLVTGVFLPYFIRAFAGPEILAGDTSSAALLSGLKGLGQGFLPLGIIAATFAPLAASVPPSCILYYVLLPMQVRRKSQMFD
jgi:hypothetical protein